MLFVVTSQPPFELTWSTDWLSKFLRNFKGTKTLEEVSKVDFCKERVICCATQTLTRVTS